MPHGFFTVEQWNRPQHGAKAEWIPILHVDCHQSLRRAVEAVEQRNQPGLYRVVQMQRSVWAEMENGKLRLRCWHASSPEGLARLAEAFERDGGRWPVENARKELTGKKKSLNKKPGGRK